MPLILVALFAALMAGAAAAHEVRPAYLEVQQAGPQTYAITWKQPTMGEVAIHLVPHLSNGWIDRAPDDQFAAAGYLVKTWTVRSAAPAPLTGQTVTIEGLDETITDVFVRVRLKNGQGLDGVVRPEVPSLKINLINASALTGFDYLVLGIQHILTGPDHLLFVLGLLLLVHDRWMLVKTISAFTAAHSLTLAAASFGLVSLDPAMLNALIALSILFLGPEIIRARRGETSLTLRHPWVVAFAFGLLHGMGFASGLRALGLDRGALVLALVMFNVGVEIGQLGFIALVLALRRSFRLMQIEWPRPLAAAPTYAIGTLGAMWTFQYTAVMFGVAL